MNQAVDTPDSSFYVYYINFGGLYSQYYISTTAPDSDGHPSATLVGTGGNGPNCYTGSTTSALFVGSFLTDGNGNIRQFWRNGDEVIFSYSTFNFYEVDFYSTDNYPICKAGAPTSPLPPLMPATATAYLADVMSWSWVGATNEMLLCPANESSTGICDVQYPESFTVPGAAGANGSATEYKQYILKASSSIPPVPPMVCVSAEPVGHQFDGTRLMAILFQWTGYVEKISHPVP
jgi:hypothetical protein